MARARKRHKLPTLIDRGMGLLEVILPHGGTDEPASTLPQGQRDTGGFWFPAGYTQPGDIFTPAQRKLQAKQRLVQRHRVRRPPGPPPIVSGSLGTSAADTAPSRPHAPPDSHAGEPADRSLPLPPPSLEAPDVRATSFETPSARRIPPGAGPTRPALAVSQRARILNTGELVDSREGSD
jgi:hypothetical protein